jgi:hypothetical protein
MQIDPNQPDEALDQILAALRNATPPEDMQTRIAHRLQHAPAPSPSRLRIFLLGHTPTAAWTRGALTGAAFAAAFILCATPLIQRRSSTPPSTQALAPSAMHLQPPAATNIDLPVRRTSTSESQSTPCAKPAITPQPRTAQPAPFRELRADAPLQPIAPSHPAPALPLTPQERQLVRLVRTASPAQLAALNPEIEAKRDAEEAANFQKFFPPPPPLSSDADTNPESTRTPPPQINE